MIDVATIRREAGFAGHQEFKGPDHTCPVCGLSVDDMLKLRRIPRCDAGRWESRTAICQADVIGKPKHEVTPG